jgi:hypothetical protein
MSEIRTFTDRPTVIPNRYVVFLKHYVDESIHQSHISTVQARCAERCVRPTDAEKPEDFVDTTIELPGLRGYAGNFDDETLREIEQSHVVRTPTTLFLSHRLIQASC